MKDFLTYLISQLVDKPDMLSVEEIQLGDKNYQYTIHADAEDMGKVIGKGGKIIQSIRNVAKILAIKKDIQIRIEVA